MADEQSKANGTVQDPESGLGTQDTDSNNLLINGGADSNNIAQSNQLPQVEDIGPDNDDSNNLNEDDNFVFSRQAYRALLRDRARLEAIESQLKNGATAQNDQTSNVKDLVNNNLNMTTDNDNNIPDTDNGTAGTNNNGQSTSIAQPNTVQQLLQVNVDTSVRPRTYANVVSTPSQNNSQNNFANSQSNTTMRPNATFLQPTVVNQQSVQSIPTQTFYSQAPQVQQNYNLPPTNFNQNLNATPIYFVDRPKPPEIPYFKHHTLEQFNKYLVNFENQCAKTYPDDREQWRTVLINKMSKEIKATLPPEAEYDWSYEKVLCNIQDYLKLNDDQVESSPMSEFWRLTKLHNETPKTFSVKLLRFFKEAHPQVEFDYDYNNVLIERFVEAQSEDTRNHIKENTLISKSTGQRIAYEAYVKLAEQFENNKRKRQQNYEKAQQNVSQPKYYPNQFKNVNQNKVCQNNELNNSYDNDCQLLQGFETTNFNVLPPNYNQNPQAKLCQNYEQQINWEGNNQNIIQGLESVNFSVPPPSCNFIPNVNNINPSVNTGHVGYAGVGSNPDYGSVPNQPIQAQQSTKPKDNPPFKNTPPGVCNYCEKRGHGRQTCRLLKAREQEPHLIWCNLCLMKNHKDVHCTYKVNIIVFQLYVPDHWCKVVGIDGSRFYSLEEWKNISIPKTADGSYEKCLQYETIISDGESVTRASNKTTGCQIGWDHDYDLFVETVATEEGWFCEKAQYSTHILAINLAGMAIGSFLLPLIADLTTGRKNMFFISIFIHLVFNLALLGVKQFYLHAIFRFLAMLASQSLFQMPYVVTVEMLNPDSRTLASFLSFVAWTVGMCLTALLTYLIPHWWFLVLISSVPSIGLLGFWRLFPESPRWLLSKGKLDEAAQILMKVAVGNGRNGVTIDKLREKLEAHWEIEKNLKIKLKQIVDFPKLCKNSIVIFLLGCFTWMAYACILLNLNILPNRYFLNFFILSIIELPSNVVGFLSANYLGRKMSALLTYAAAAIFSLICVFSLKERILLLCMVGLVKLFMTEGIYLLYVISGEIFPTPIRSTGVGMMVVIGTLGTIASPYIIEAGEVFQYSVMLALSLACVALSLLLPETLGLPLPQTLQDAEALGEGRPFFKWIHHWNVNDVNARSNQGQIYSLSAPKL